MAHILEKLFQGRKERAISCCAVVAAAGSSARMQGGDKIMMPLDGEPVLVHTLRQLEGCRLIQEIIVVTRNDLIVAAGELCKANNFTKVSKVIAGGKTRMESVFAGIGEVAPGINLIAIHDGARPLVTQELLNEVIVRGAECAAAAPAIALKDTVKRVNNGFAEGTLARNQLVGIQTPQVFEASLIRAALLKALQDKAELTDDCAAVERMGMKVALTKGSEENIKITTPFDLLLAEAILEWRDKP